MALGMIWDPEKRPSGKQIWSHVASEKPFRRHGWSKDTFAATLYPEIVSLTESFIHFLSRPQCPKTPTVPQNKLSYVISLTKILSSSNENEDIFSSKNSAKIEFPAPPSTIWKCFWILLFLTCTATLSADNYDYDNHPSWPVGSSIKILHPSSSGKAIGEVAIVLTSHKFWPVLLAKRLCFWTHLPENLPVSLPEGGQVQTVWVFPLQILHVHLQVFESISWVDSF